MHPTIQVSLSVWRDEVKGLVNGMKPEDLGDPANTTGVIDITADAEPAASTSRPLAPPYNSPSPINGEDVDMGYIPMRPTSSSTEDTNDDIDIDALIKEEEERLARMRAPAAPAS